MKVQLTYNTIGESLVDSIPEFRETYEDHIKYYDEVIQHVLFGEFTRFVLDIYRKFKSDPSLNDLLKRSLEFIESCFLSNDPKVDELAHVSFLESLFGEPECEEIKKRLGPMSLKHLDMIEHPEKL